MFKAKGISIITIGVKDLEKSIKFYESIGFEYSPDSDPNMCTFLMANNIVLGIVPYEFLANDVKLPLTEKTPYSGFTLALNGADKEEVDGLFNLAVKNGATPHEYPVWKDWGGYNGYSGYFLDPDGYPWEVAYAPFLNLTLDNVLVPKKKADAIG